MDVSLLGVASGDEGDEEEADKRIILVFHTHERTLKNSSWGTFSNHLRAVHGDRLFEVTHPPRF